MSKKNVLGLILFGFITTVGLFVGVDYMINRGVKVGTDQNQYDITKEETPENSTEDNETLIAKTEPWLTTNPSDIGQEKINETPEVPENTRQAKANITKQDEESQVNETDSIETDLSDENSNAQTPSQGDASKDADVTDAQDIDSISNPSVENIATNETAEDIAAATETVEEASANTLGKPVLTAPDLELIYNSEEVNYEDYIPEMVFDSKIETSLDIDNPDLKVEAKAAILIDADTNEVLFYKNPIEPVFPASTSKLLTCLVTLDWCKEDEKVTIGEEINMRAPDSSIANIKVGQILTIRNLLEGMLLPSGNDAAYAAAAYVGRKSLDNKDASNLDAVKEFVRLMNLKAKQLGVKNSCFKTPDGYDALGQYTTAYDMAQIGLAAMKNKTILEISQKSRSRNIFVSGEDVTWPNSNSLINKNSPRYFSKAIGLKTGTSTMAGKCLIAAAQDNDREVLCVIMNSSSSGRYEDAIALLQYGLNNKD